MSAFISIIPQVTGPFSLLAFGVAVYFWYLRRKDKSVIEQFSRENFSAKEVIRILEQFKGSHDKQIEALKILMKDRGDAAKATLDNAKKIDLIDHDRSALRLRKYTVVFATAALLFLAISAIVLVINPKDRPPSTQACTPNITWFVENNQKRTKIGSVHGVYTICYTNGVDGQVTLSEVGRLGAPGNETITRPGCHTYPTKGDSLYIVRHNDGGGLQLSGTYCRQTN